MRNKSYLAFLLLLGFASCKNGNDTTANIDTAQTDGHPKWIMQGNIYEVNVRQYTPEGTFAAFAKGSDGKFMGENRYGSVPSRSIF